jgi:hypothetical protein
MSKICHIHRMATNEKNSQVLKFIHLARLKA